MTELAQNFGLLVLAIVVIGASQNVALKALDVLISILGIRKRRRRR